MKSSHPALYRVLCIGLCLACLMGTLAACSPADPSSNPDATTKEDTMDTTTLPDTDNLTEDTVLDTTPETEAETDRVKVEQVITRIIGAVTLSSGSTETEAYAASELTKYLTQKGVSVDTASDAYHITLTIDEDIPDDGYTMTVKRKEATIAGGNGRGLLYGVYRFLEEFGGVRYFTPTMEVVPAGKLSITTGTIEYRPVFIKRTFDWYPNRTSQDWMVKNGINDCGWYGAFTEEVGGNWDSSVLSVHTMGQLTETGDSSSPNPCLTDPENLRRAIANVRKVLEEHPGLTGVSVSQNDNNSYCQCANCAAIDREEGSPSGTLLRFVNAVAADIAEDYPDVVVDTFAYMYTQAAPKITKPLPNVAVRLCSIRCHFSHPISDENCDRTATFNRDLQAWSEICENIHIWDYTTNYRFSIPTFPNFTVMRENMRYFAEHNVTGMFPEGNYFSTSGEFGELRAYLLAKLMMDPYMTEREYYTHMDEFLSAYYGGGWIYLRAYIDSTCALAANNCQSIYADPYAAIPRETLLAMEDAYELWWNRAEELAGDCLDNVKRSRLQWRYIRLMLHPNEEEAKQFIADVNAYGIAWGEGDLRTLPADADLTKPPHEWFTFTWWL